MLPWVSQGVPSFHIPVHVLADDLAWTKGPHSLQFGTNLRIIDDVRASTGSASGASINTRLGSGLLRRLQEPDSRFDPAIYGFPAVGD
jgi:hypothetical protein